MTSRALRRRNLLLRILTTRSRVNIFRNSTHNRFTKHTNHDSYSRSNAKATTDVIMSCMGCLSFSYKAHDVFLHLRYKAVILK